MKIRPTQNKTIDQYKNSALLWEQYLPQTEQWWALSGLIALHFSQYRISTRNITKTPDIWINIKNVTGTNGVSNYFNYTRTQWKLIAKLLVVCEQKLGILGLTSSQCSTLDGKSFAKLHQYSPPVYLINILLKLLQYRTRQEKLSDKKWNQSIRKLN